MARKEITRLPIDERCEGCGRIEEIENEKYCSKYTTPSFHWENNQICSFATHIKREMRAARKVLNPLKASKRASAKKK
ncbi:MAG: PxxKW family cysteine-rich protein [bacterium]